MQTPLGAIRAPSVVGSLLVQRGHEVTLIAQCSSPHATLDGLPLIKVAGDTYEDWIHALRLHGPFDIIVGLSRIDIFQQGLALRQICWNHNPSVLYGVPEYGRPLYHLTQKVVCPSESSARQQVSWGIPEKKIAIVPNGLDRAIFSERHASASETDRKDKLLFVGSCNAWKGLDIVLRAFALLKEQRPSLTLDLYGDTQPWPLHLTDMPAPPLTSDCHIDWSTLQERQAGITYHGIRPRREIADALCHSSLLLCASRHEETFALAPLEAQACGCLPVAPALGAYPERITDNQNGFLFHPNTAETMAQRISHILKEQEKLPSLRRRAMAHAHAFDWKNTAEQMEKLALSLPKLRRTQRLAYHLHKTAKSLVPRIS